MPLPRLDNPLIVQSDHTVLVQVDSPRYADARDGLLAFAELVKSPEHVHTYRITPLSIWNACAAGVQAERILAVLEEYSKYPVPQNVAREVVDYASRYGRLRLERGLDSLELIGSDPEIATEVATHRSAAPLLGRRLSPTRFSVDPLLRGRLKQALIKIGFPVQDLAGYTPGESLATTLRETTCAGLRFDPRDYQRDAARRFHAAGSDRGGSGVIVLPCGAGKTIVGLACMATAQTSTLVLTTGVTAARQWIGELLDKTSLLVDQVGEYSGEKREIRPVTVATYHILTHRTSREAEFTHWALFDQRDWGLIIYDEVHLLPAPVFQATAGLQARRRLGLTATLVREDGHEDDVFALIGPKCTDMPWKTLESQGWIAKASCTEIRVPLPGDQRVAYAVADAREKFRLASENPDKARFVAELLARHDGEQALVIGMYVDQLERIAAELALPLLTGSTPQRRRDHMYAEFRAGRIRALVVSKVANFAIDLPDASVAVQISGTFGSRQEEAQRLGRILRPKAGANQAHFYSLVSRDTVEQEFAMKRQLFLCEQGYSYRIVDAEELGEPSLVAAGR
jgi:DNA excision repair protein ERCC-3